MSDSKSLSTEVKKPRDGNLIILPETMRFMLLFEGLHSAYGVFLPATEQTPGEKIKGQFYIEKQELTEVQYGEHLDGIRGLSIIPINEEGLCYFGVIDVDTYKDHTLLIDVVLKYNFPLVPFRSKSGGVHLYAFFKNPEKANDVIEILTRIKSILGLGEKAEIFPKQASRKEGMIGNGVNLPYYDSEKTARHVLALEGERTALFDVLLYCEQKRTQIKAMESFLEALPLSDAPPCLQTIYLRGTTENRNNYVFSMARYYKAKFGDAFDSYTMEANLLLSHPLTAQEVAAAVTSNKKKEYSYKCTDEPLKSLCSKRECAQRKYGVGGDSVSELVFEELCQYTADPPYYEWKVNGKILRFLDEEEIIYQNAFRKLCMRRLHVLPKRLKDDAWGRIVNNALKNVVIKRIDDEDDVSPGALFRDHLIEFLTRRAMAATKEQILFDKVFFDEAIEAYIFKPKNFLAFLIYQKQFRFFGQTDVQARLRDMGAGPLRYYVSEKNSATRVWSIPRKSIVNFVDTVQDEVIVEFKEEYKDEAF